MANIEDIIFKEEWDGQTELPSFIQAFRTEICELNYEEGGESLIGKVTYYLFYPMLVPPNAMFDAADVESDDLVELAGTFFGSNGPLNWESDAFEGEITGNLLYLASMTLDPSVRGKGLGLDIIRTIIDRHGKGTHVALRPAPVEDRPGVSRDAGIAKLRAYWKRLNFNREAGEFLWNNCA